MVSIETPSELFEILTLIVNVWFLLFLFSFWIKLAFHKSVLFFDSTLRFFKRDGVLIGFVISLVATLGSLYYSDILGYNPCILCWYQLIVMYPQVFLFGIALFTKKREVFLQSLVLSVIGFLLALYHYLGQVDVLQGTCDYLGYSSGCSDFFTLAFGYITIPMMAITAFGILIIVSLSALHRKKGYLD